MEDDDDFKSSDPKRAHRRLKALPAKQQNAATSNTASHKYKRRTPASVTPISKRPAVTPKPFTVNLIMEQGMTKTQYSSGLPSSETAATKSSSTPQEEQHGCTPLPKPTAIAHDVMQDQPQNFSNGKAAYCATPTAQAAAAVQQSAGCHAVQHSHGGQCGSAEEAEHCSQGLQNGVQRSAAAVHVVAAQRETGVTAGMSECCSVCPVCGCSLGAISSTGTGQMAHVNACIDAAAAPAGDVTVPLTAAAATDAKASLAAADAPPDSAGAATQPEAATEAQGQHQQDTGCIDLLDDDISSWLNSIGASVVADQFAAAEVDFSVLPHLNEHDLEDMGVCDESLRCCILTAAAELAAEQAGAGRGWHHQSMQQHGGQQEQSHDNLEQDTPWAQQQSDPSHGQMTESGAGWHADEWDACHHDIEQGIFDVADEELKEAGVGQLLPTAAETQHVSTYGIGNIAQRQDHTWQQQQQQEPAQQGRSGVVERPPLRPVQAAATRIAMGNRSMPRSSSRSCLQAAVGQDRQQSSITGWLQQNRQQQHTQQQGSLAEHQQSDRQQKALLVDAKQQWQSLFNRPGKVLAPPQPQQARQRALNQMQLGQAGQRRQPQYQQQQEPAELMQLPPIACTAPLPRWWPAWRRLPGTNIIVDAFGQSSKGLGSNRAWVLTHFHADHYMGLSKGFKQGHILCTPLTAALVKLKLRVPDSVLVPVPLGQEVTVEGTRLQFVDANHCPGAAMIVAHPPGGLPPVLHTGDARLTREATQQQPALQALVGKAVLVLDTTYADPAYCFPPQQDVLQWTLRAVQAESFNPRCLFLFGSYTIGKERLFLHVAQAMRAKVYVAAAKRGVMNCIGLTPEQQQLLTTNHLEANIHVVPMRQVSLESMESLLVRYKGRYTAVVGFQPTGWTHTAGATSNSRSVGQASRTASTVKPGRRIQRGTVVLYKVPYSEHSSCAELRDFVSWLKPIRIIPSVNNDNGPKLRQMMQTVTSNGRATGPMDAFAMQRPQELG